MAEIAKKKQDKMGLFNNRSVTFSGFPCSALNSKGNECHI